MAELESQLMSIYLTNILLNALELGTPMALNYYRLRKEEKRAKIHGKEMSTEEKESILSQFESTTDEYMEIIIGYGYMVMFGMAFPFTPLFAIVFTIVELRVDAIKLCYFTSRPYPAQDNTIGIWNDIATIVSYVGAAVNIAVLTFTANAFRFDNDKDKWICFIFVQNGFFLLKTLIRAAIGDMTENTRDGIIWCDRMVNEKLYGKIRDVDLERQTRQLHYVTIGEDRAFRLDEVYK